MNRFKKSVVNVAGYIVFVGTVALFAPYNARGQHPGGQPSPVPNPVNVKVTNTQSEPVPVTGTVTVDNLGSSPLPVTGTVNVGNLGNNPLPVRVVEKAAQVPFQQQFELDMNSAQIDRTVSVTIPAGKMLVVEYASGGASLPRGQKMHGLKVGTSSPSIFHLLPFNFHSPSVFQDDLFVASGPVRMYATGTVSISVSRNALTGSALVVATVTGYLVDVP